MNQLDPNKQYIGAGLELDEARMLRDILTMFRADHPDFYSEFATKFGEALAFQIDNELTLPGDILSAMMGVVPDEEEVQYGCHCDLEPGQAPDECYIDTDKREQCVYARRHEQKDQCEYWQPIRIERNH